MTQTVRILRFLDPPRSGAFSSIKLVEPSTACPDPQIPMSIFMNGKHKIMAQTVWVPRLMNIVPEECPVPDILVEPAAIRTDPEHTGVIFKDRLDGVVTQTVQVAGFMDNVAEALILPVEFIQATRTGADPQVI